MILCVCVGGPGGARVRRWVLVVVRAKRVFLFRDIVRLYSPGQWPCRPLFRDVTYKWARFLVSWQRGHMWGYFPL